MIRSHPVQLAAMIAAFTLGTVLALLLGAGSLGIALTFGQIAFAVTLVWVLLKG
jgi:hypothetical protein